MFFTLLPILYMGILSCGSGDTPIGQGGSPTDSGDIAPRVQWDYRNPFNSPLSKGDRGLLIPSPLVGEGQGEGVVMRKAPLGVYKVRAILLDTSNNPVSGFQTTKDVAPGDSGTITFTNVPAGTYNDDTSTLCVIASEAKQSQTLKFLYIKLQYA